MTTPFPATERPAFFAGQLLAAADLTAQSDAEAGLRALHHRALQEHLPRPEHQKRE